MQNQSSVVNTEKLLEFKSKEDLKFYARSLLGERRFRVMTKPQDTRSKGFAFALMEEIGTNGELVFLTGAPSLNMLGNFLKVKAEAKEIV